MAIPVGSLSLPDETVVMMDNFQRASLGATLNRGLNANLSRMTLWRWPPKLPSQEQANMTCLGAVVC